MANETTGKVVSGKVKWFDVKKGYGFITDEEGKDVFVHFSGITKGRHFIGLNEGDKVTFEVGENNEGKAQAENVELIRKKNEDGEEAADDAGDAE